MAAAIIAALTALPGIVKIIQDLGPELVNLSKELWTWINHVSGNDPQGFVKSVGQAMAQLNQAQTPEQRQDAAKAIADAIRGLK